MVCSRREIAAAEGQTRIGTGSIAAISWRVRTICGHVVKYPGTLIGGSLRKLSNEATSQETDSDESQRAGSPEHDGETGNNSGRCYHDSDLE